MRKRNENDDPAPPHLHLISSSKSALELVPNTYNHFNISDIIGLHDKVQQQVAKRKLLEFWR